MSSLSNSVSEKTDDSSKLISLLALATGAVAMPQTSNADIIFTDLSSNPALVGWGNGYSDSFTFSLPGTSDFGFVRGQYTFTGFSTFVGTYTFYSQYVTAGLVGTGNAGLQAQGGFVVPLNAGQAWDQGFQTYLNAGVGVATAVYYPILPTARGRNPLNGYDHKFLAWAFTDTTQGGATRYGWVEISLLITDFPVGPNVTIWGYAYDNTGAEPTMGQIPEPASGSLMALGALALGARGLRSWRRNKVAAANS
jgi:hypothetical protein